MPSVPWRCWLGGRKGIRPVKNRVVGCWHGYLSGARCRLAYGPADANATHCLFASVKSRLVVPLWYRLTRVVPDKGPLNVCVCVSIELQRTDAFFHIVTHQFDKLLHSDVVSTVIAQTTHTAQPAQCRQRLRRTRHTAQTHTDDTVPPINFIHPFH